MTCSDLPPAAARQAEESSDQRTAAGWYLPSGAEYGQGLPVYSIICLNTSMIQAVAVGASHPVVAGLLGLGTAGLAGAVVAMAWSVHARQIRLVAQLARRQFIVTGETGVTAPAANGHDSAWANGHGGPAANGHGRANGYDSPAANGYDSPAANGHGSPGANGHRNRVAAAQEVRAAAGPGLTPPVVIDGPDTVVTGEQARYRVLPSGGRTVVSWAAGGGSVAQSPDPAHPDELLLIADQPGSLAVTVRVREGMTQHRGTKSVTAVPDVTAAPPFTLRPLLNGWGLVVVAVLITGFAGALDALGDLTSADFIALVVPLAALLAVVTAMRGTDDPGSRPGNGTARPRF